MLRHFPLFVSFMVIFANGISDSIHAQTKTNSLVYYLENDGIQVNAADRHAGGGYLLCGEGYMSGFIAKTDENGNPELVKGVADHIISDIIHETDSGFTTVGYRQTGNNILNLMRWNAQADTLWTMNLELNRVWYPRLRRLANQDYLISATTMTEASELAPLLLRVSPQGALLWSKIYEPTSNEPAYAYSAAELPDGNLLITGYIASPGNYRVLLIQTDAQGNPLLSRTFTFQNTYHNACYDVVQGEEGITLLCETDNDIALMRIGSDLNPLWGKSFHSYFYLYLNESKGNLIRNTDGSLLLSGSSDWGNFIKTDSQGTPEYILDAFMYMADAVPADDGGTMLFGNGPLIGVKSFPGYYPQIGVYRCDSLGEGSSCVGKSTPTFEEAEIDSEDIQFIATPAGILQQNPAAIYELEFLSEAACVSFIGNVQNNITESGQILACPNPADTWFSVDLNQEMHKKFSRLEIFSSGGQIVYKSFDPSIAAGAIPCSQFPAGIYLIRVIAGNKSYTGKISIQH
ncbi:T9SS type A sorting domain-containing protein [Lentimicrobium sp.]|uniref:T9SS type A sorting domain-containing protein n=1 Tax=Lentimicrobium sp. TaxID=2034841 RepID=UPI002C4E1DAE|nr:T9SS type A sorting domain-containing protein [Lentimicrobium sp.]HPJ61427.1 T9SS type A sorting domain-containing protein [Lentimicrobium sp.]HPR25233.1 T9SS type A sorting domain-containing protein [Lentimicrobium sp.]